MAATNWYDEYDFSPDTPLQTIQCALRQKIQDEENDSFSDGHSQRLARLKEAQAVFSNDASRAAYDKSLEPEVIPEEQPRSSMLEKWLPNVIQYYDAKRYREALTALENALSQGNPDLENAEVFELAAKVYKENKQFPQAITNVDKAIVAVGVNKDARYLYLKADIYDCYAYAAPKDQKPDLVNATKETLRLAISSAEKVGDKRIKALSYSLLAYVWYYRHGYNSAEAEKYAKIALSLASSMIYAKKVMNAIRDDRRKFLQGKVDQLGNLDQQINAKNKQLANMRFEVQVDGIIAIAFIAGIALIVLGIILGIAVKLSLKWIFLPGLVITGVAWLGKKIFGSKNSGNHDTKSLKAEVLALQAQFAQLETEKNNYARSYFPEGIPGLTDVRFSSSVASVAVPVVAPATASHPVASVKAKFCSKCGTRLLDTAKFCPACGAKTITTT